MQRIAPELPGYLCPLCYVPKGPLKIFRRAALEKVYYKGDQYVIERAGRPMAAVVPVWQLEEWCGRRERLFGMIEEVWQRNKKMKPEVITREVTSAVKAVRNAARKRV